MTPLYAPEQYWRLSEQVREQMVNGCGPGGWKVDLVPDRLYGLSVRASCNIHDYMYAAGSTIADKDEADRVFLNNMLRQIDDGSDSRLLRTLRRRRARTYYAAVHHFGGPFFWWGKNPTATMGFAA